MSQTVVPAKDFFLRLRKIVVSSVGSGNGLREVCSNMADGIMSKASGSWKIVQGIDEDVNTCLTWISRIGLNSPGISTNSDRIVSVDLAKDSSTEESLLDLSNVVGRELQMSKLAVCIKNRPANMTKTFNLQTIDNTMDLASMNRLDFTDKVLLVTSDAHRSTRIPDQRVGIFWIHFSLTSSWMLQNHIVCTKICSRL